MRILVACEYSGLVRDAFIARGHDAISCDLLPTESPGPHYQCDVHEVMNQQWDMMIAFPPCQYLAISGRALWHYHKEDQRRALNFVWYLMNRPIERICIENPVGKISTVLRKPTQIIQPSMFGESLLKTTCLWLKGLPPLIPTQRRPGYYWTINRNGANHGIARAHHRSRTFPAVAKAMAEQWG